MQKSYNGSGKEKAAEYYIVNTKVLRENVKIKYRNLWEEEKNQINNMEEIDIWTWQKMKK